MPNAERGCGSGVVYEVNIPNSMYESSVYVSCTCNMTTTCVCMQCGTGGADRAHGGGPRARASRERLTQDARALRANPDYLVVGHVGSPRWW
jgi:hypothetical protein